MTRSIRSAVVAFGLVASLAPPAASAATVSDLAVSLASERGSAPVGDEVGLEASVTNLGPDEAAGAIVTFQLPPGAIPDAAPGCSLTPVIRCELASLAPGATAVVGARVSLTLADPLTLEAVVDAAGDDPVAANDRATATVRGTGRDCDAVGTRAADDLRGRGVVCGLGGHDLLLGGRRKDVLLGGSGHDALAGGKGRDRIDGGADVDACARETAGERPRECERRVFAMAGRLPLAEPTRAVVGYGYHQSLFRTAIGLRALEPRVVMRSRGRGTGSTTAVDVVVPPRGRIASPVTGTVVGVTRYRLYCQDLDWKVVIEPRSHPDLRVLVLHMARPSVSEGAEVEAGVTRIGRAQVNDEPSAQENLYFADRYPHVHIEVERNRASPTPGCAA